MPAPLIRPDASLDTILNECSYTLGELQSHALAAPLTPQFDAFQTTWFTAHTARTMLVIAVGKGDGAVAGADDGLDDFVDTLDRTLLIATKNDRKAPLYQLYFGLKTPNLTKRPILGTELATVREFIPSLQTSSTTALAALAPQLVALVAAADAAVTQRNAAVQALKDYDAVGGKKTLIDAFNALRQSVYGTLAAIPHQNPGAMLPGTFADRFFRHETHKGITAMTNPSDVKLKIESLQKETAAAEAHLKTLDDAAAAQLKAGVAEQAIKEQLAQAQKDKDAADKKVKELQKEAKAGKKKKK